MSLNPNGPFPQQFDRFRIDRVLGHGGQAFVYQAHDEDLHRPVALKIPRPSDKDPLEVREAFLEEGRIGARFKHPNFCGVYRSGVCDGTPFLALEYIEGKALSDFRNIDWLASTPLDTAEIVMQLALALEVYHADGLLHRDLKPHNVLVTPPPERRVVILDFGLALRLNAPQTRMPYVGQVVGTCQYMAPEQIRTGVVPLSLAADIWSLGVILYELLTFKLPFEGNTFTTLARQITNDAPRVPSELRPQIGPGLDAVCQKALAKRPRDRYRTMAEFAQALANVIYETRSPSVEGTDLPPRPLVRPEAIRYAFAGLGERVRAGTFFQNRLFLDVGNDLRAGVIDHHQLTGDTGSTARLVLNRLDLIDAAVDPRGADEFTLVLHQDPDLDCLVSTFLAIAYLTTGTLPEDVDPLIQFADDVDTGKPGMSLERPFTLYAAWNCLLHRRTNETPEQRWTAAIGAGLKLLDHILKQAREQRGAIRDVDAFAAPGLFTAEERAVVAADTQRYAARLRDDATAARMARMRLPAQFGDPLEVDALLVRDVSHPDDPTAVRYFKDWARSDKQRSPQRKGFAALSVFHSERGGRARRCILSVKPESDASLRGLGALLDQAETEKRLKVFGKDCRRVDPLTGAELEKKPGYDNADPWYDGRAHAYTIVDSPRSGTVLTAEEIEEIFLDYGQARAVPLPVS